MARIQNQTLRYVKVRGKRGNILALTIAVIGVLGVTIAILGLQTLRMVGSHQEQNTAIEAAALAAANDLAKVYVEDPNFGFVSLANQPPTGKATVAGDGYFLELHSIDSIFGTLRLQAIIANLLNDATLKTFVQRDYNNALLAKDRLVQALNNACVPNSVFTDMDGNQVNMLKDAIDAYQKNSVHMASSTNYLIPNSMKITLGYGTNLPTFIFVPQPAKYSQVSASQQQNNCYNADTLYSINGMNFVFAAVGSQQSTLIDQKVFRTSVPGVPYSIPSILKCEADHQSNNSGDLSVTNKFAVHDATCVMPGSLNDRRPAPGMFLVSFPSGQPNNINLVSDMFTNYQATTAPTDLLCSPLTGDNPPVALTNVSLPVVGSHPAIGKMIRVALYDWMKRAASNLNIDSLMSMLNCSFLNPGAPQVHQFALNAEGGIDYTACPTNPNFYVPTSNDQYFARSEFAIEDTNQHWYDIFIRDYGWQPGRINGGIHAGEPLLVPDYLGPNGNQPSAAQLRQNLPNLDLNPALTDLFPTGSGQKRPTYEQNGIVVDVRFIAR